MRDAQVSLDQLISLSEGRLGLDTARQLLGLVESDLLEQLLSGLVQRDTPKCLLLIRDLVEKGRDLHRFIKTFTAYLRDAMMLRAGAPLELLKVSRSNPDALARAIDGLSFPTLLNFMQQFLELEEKMRTAAPARFLLEFTVIKLTAIHPRFVLDQLGNPGSQPLPETPAPRASAPANTHQSTPPAMAAMKPLPPVTGSLVYTGSSPQAALLRESAPMAEESLPMVETGEVEYPAPEEVPPVLTAAQMIEQFRTVGDTRLSPSVAVLLQSDVQFEDSATIAVLVPPRIAVVAPMLERPENLAVLRKLAQEIVGSPCRIRIGVAQVVDLESAQETFSSDDPLAVADTVEPMVMEDLPPLLSPESVATAATESTDSKPRNLREAMVRFPDFREAIELVRKHCGAEPVLFNGQRV